MWSWLLAGAYILASLIVSLLLAIDKRAARRARRRIPESTLHTVELLGGWPGSLLARTLLRHKTRKRRYRAAFWLIVILHVAAWTAWALWKVSSSRQP